LQQKIIFRRFILKIDRDLHLQKKLLYPNKGKPDTKNLVNLTSKYPCSFKRWTRKNTLPAKEESISINLSCRRSEVQLRVEFTLFQFEIPSENLYDDR
jgi:hypothetical protein